jgi:hypothetical protein
MTEKTPAQKSKNADMIKAIKKQNPGVKVKRVQGGGFQIMNPRTPSPLLTGLLKRLDKTS